MSASGVRSSGTSESAGSAATAAVATPRVSIVIPAYNAARWISAALESVAAQTYRDFEVVLCDDGSTDGTRQVAEALLGARGVGELRVLTLGGRGAGGARNEGIRAARGEFVAFLDDDDWWTADKLARCLERLDAGLDLVCHAEWWADVEGPRKLRRYSELFDAGRPPVVAVMRNNPFSTSAVVVRRSVLLAAGLFDETLPSAEDFDLWVRCVMQPGLRIGFIDEPLGTYFLREGSESAKIDRRMRALLTIGEKYAPALRAASPTGGLEHWIYVARVRFTTGLRLAAQGERAKGARLALTGFAMWPFRFDWVLLALRERRRGVGAASAAPATGGTA